MLLLLFNNSGSVQALPGGPAPATSAAPPPIATVSSDDIRDRVRKLLPGRWWQWAAPLRDALLGGLSDSALWCYSWIVYARLQIRLRTATGPWLDIASLDFLGNTLPRRLSETDPLFSARLIREILRPRNTRAAVLQMIFDLTGNAGKVQEPWNPLDWGGYGLPYSGYGIALGYGSLQFNNQIFVRATRPNGSGIPNVSGYGMVGAGYGTGPLEYGDLSQLVAPVTDAEIYARIAQTVSAGTTAWTDIISLGTSNTGAFDLIGTQSGAMAVFQAFF